MFCQCCWHFSKWALRKWFHVLLKVCDQVQHVLFVLVFFYVGMLAQKPVTCSFPQHWISVLFAHLVTSSTVIWYQIVSWVLRNVCLLRQSLKLDIKTPGTLEENHILVCSGKCGLDCSSLMVIVRKYFVPFQRGLLGIQIPVPTIKVFPFFLFELYCADLVVCLIFSVCLFVCDWEDVGGSPGQLADVAALEQSPTSELCHQSCGGLS